MELPVHLRRGAAQPSATSSIYEQVGGMKTFETLAHHFYEGVQHDPVLWPMYPQDDLEGAVWRLSRFLGQYFGGPTSYSAVRGHPRLRMRHLPFHVNPDARSRWLQHMTQALDKMDFPPVIRAAFAEYFDRAATAMVNTFEPTPNA